MFHFNGISKFVENNVRYWFIIMLEYDFVEFNHLFFNVVIETVSIVLWLATLCLFLIEAVGV